jgi:large subunit ribosomal protein L21
MEVQTLSMYAVVETGSKQYKVAEGDIIKVEKLSGQPGDEIVFSQVLLFSGDDGRIDIGTPRLDNVRVVGEILLQGRAKKIIVYKYKKRKNYRRKQGHRQAFTKIKIAQIAYE